MYNLGKEMFLEGNYTGAQDLLAEFIKVSSDAMLKEEAAYMMAVSSFHRGHEKSGGELKYFLAAHPETVHRHEISFLVGSFYFDRKE
jgi:TolA-binding protein